MATKLSSVFGVSARAVRHDVLLPGLPLKTVVSRVWPGLCALDSMTVCSACVCVFLLDVGKL